MALLACLLQAPLNTGRPVLKEESLGCDLLCNTLTGHDPPETLHNFNSGLALA